MDRTKLLMLALEHCKDPRAALDLAREMAGFVGGTERSGVKPEEGQEIKVVAPAESKTIIRRRRTRRTWQAWTPHDRKTAAALLDMGLSMREAAERLGRTKNALVGMFSRGELPCKVRTKSPRAEMAGKAAMAARYNRTHASA